MVESSLIGKFTKKIFYYFSNNWVINSDINYYETKCFKMMTQDPNDLTVSMYSALSTQVAKYQCNESFGGSDRYSALKTGRSFNAIKLIFQLENILFMILKKTKKNN